MPNKNIAIFPKKYLDASKSDIKQLIKENDNLKILFLRLSSECIVRLLMLQGEKNTLAADRELFALRRWMGKEKNLRGGSAYNKQHLLTAKKNNELYDIIENRLHAYNEAKATKTLKVAKAPKVK